MYVPKLIDLTNRQFGNLLVLNRAQNHILPSGKPRTKWNCICSCGNQTCVSTQSLIQGTTISCGCIGKLHRKQSNEASYDDLVGNRYGRLTVVKRDISSVTKSGQRKTRFICKCDCGNIVSVLSNSLKDGRTKSCGCSRKEITSKRKLIDLTGRKFGRLTVVRKAYTKYFPSTSVAYWECKCECGSIIEVSSQKLRSGWTSSCGCLESKNEEIISKFLSSKNIVFKRQFSFNNLISSKGLPLRFDFAIFKNGTLLCLIEYQGIQHYKDCGWFGYTQREYTDEAKRQYCKQNNLKLFEIRYDENTIDACNNIIQDIAC